jgi:hypothetical protein
VLIYAETAIQSRNSCMFTVGMLKWKICVMKWAAVP